MADTKHAIGVVQDAALSGERILQMTYANIASQLLATNKSATSLVTADVARLSTATTEAALDATSTSPYHPALVVPEDINIFASGVAKTVLADAAGWMYKPGAFVPDAAVDGAVDVGEYLTFSATSNKFTGTGAITVRPASAQAIALAATAVAGNIPILLLHPTPRHASTRVINTADIPIAVGAPITSVYLTFNTELYDVGGLHSTTSNTGRLTIPAGWPTALYDITASVTFTSTAAGAQRSMGIVLNHVTNIASRICNWTLHCEIGTVYRLAAGDYVEVLISNPGDADTVKYYANYSPVFTITQIQE